MTTLVLATLVLAGIVVAWSVSRIISARRSMRQAEAAYRLAEYMCSLALERGEPIAGPVAGWPKAPIVSAVAWDN